MQTAILYRGTAGGATAATSKDHAILLATATFCIAILAIYLPCLIFVFGVHNDADQIYNKLPGWGYHEADHLYAIGRPIAALIARLPLVPATSLADFRWARLLSLVTIGVMGWGMIHILVSRLRVSAISATAITF